MIDYFKVFFKVVLWVNIVVLLTTFFIEYYYALGVCRLCSYQQYIYIAVAVLVFIGMYMRFLEKPIGVIVVILYLINAGIALSQVMMEEHFMDAPSSCTGLIPSVAVTLEEYRERILANDFIPCDLPSIRMLSISLAGYSFAISTTMLLFTGIFVSVFLFYRYGDEEATKRI